MVIISEVDQDTKEQLQTKANYLLATQFDGSGDWWEYFMLGDTEWAINIFDDHEFGSAKEPDTWKISAYVCDEDGVSTEDWIPLKVNKIYEFVLDARLKVKGKR